MAVVKGYAELIESENASEKIQGFAHEIRTAVDKLLALIEQFLDYRKIEEGKVKFNFEDIDLVNLIKEMIKNFSVIAKSKKLELKFETQSEHCIVKADSLRLSQVIQNLIDNAIKYTSSGEVSVELKKEDNYVLITVADSGRGIPKEIQPKLFGEFIRDPAIKKEIAGTGLGLYISKYIIDAHNGKIWVESEGVGKGSKFFIKLPL
jgi:signal transduction histidine kinase